MLEKLFLSSTVTPRFIVLFPTPGIEPRASHARQMLYHRAAISSPGGFLFNLESLFPSYPPPLSSTQ